MSTKSYQIKTKNKETTLFITLDDFNEDLSEIDFVNVNGTKFDSHEQTVDIVYNSKLINMVRETKNNERKVYLEVLSEVSGLIDKLNHNGSISVKLLQKELKALKGESE